MPDKMRIRAFFAFPCGVRRGYAAQHVPQAEEEMTATILNGKLTSHEY
jgi:hypothetical protein